MKVGMMGAGVMAQKMTNTLKQLEGFELYALASAFPAECEPFVREQGWKKSFQTYEELLSDPEVDLVYIPVPTRLHLELAKLALRYKKPVLCEKPLCVNEAQTKELLDYAKEQQVFLAEALWSNFMPIRKEIDKVLESGELGELTDVEIVFRNDVIHEPRYKKFELAAGALMDVGSYSIGCCMVNHLGYDVELVDSSFTWLPNGLDLTDDLYFQYPNGLKVHVYNNVHSDIYQKYCWYIGTKGKLFVDGTSNPKGIKVYDLAGNLLKDIPAPKQISGYEYQWFACDRALKEGKLEPDEVPHKEVLQFIHVMDMIRAKMGLKFPFE